MYVAGMSTPDKGKTVRHLIWCLAVGSGKVRKDWPVDVAPGEPFLASSTHKIDASNGQRRNRY